MTTNVNGSADPSAHRTPVPSPFDILADELGAVAGRIEREASLRLAAAIADVKRIEAEWQMRLERIERTALERVAELKDGKDGQDGEPGKDGEPGQPGQPGEPGPPGEIPFAPEEIAQTISRAIATLAQSEPVAPHMGQFVFNIGGNDRPRQKTITMRQDGNGNAVADVIERAD